MKRLFFLLLMCIPILSFSQLNGDYRTIPDVVGVWSDVGIWEVYSGGSWGPASNYPNNITNDITIENVEFFEMDVDITLPVGCFILIDDLTVIDLSINSGCTLTNKDDGNIIGEWVITVFGTYKHDKNGGTIPALGNWDFGSTLEISGMVDSQPNGLTTQSFKTLNINSSGMTADFDLSGIDFSELLITNTGSKAAFVDEAISYTQNITIEANGVFKVKTTGRLTATGTITNHGNANNVLVKGDHISSGSLIYNNALAGTYQQYITAGKWHLIGIPVVKGTGATLGAFNPATGDGYMRAYVTSNSDWGPYMQDETIQLDVGQGYEYWTTVNNTVNLTGNYNTGNVNLTLSSAGNQYNLLSNPYPCAIDWETVTTRTNALSQSVYYYSNSAGTNGYAVYSGATHSGTYGATQYIPPFQGFFVEQTTGTSMTFTNSNKAHPNTSFYKSETENGVFDRLRIQIAQDTLWSEAVIVLVDGATNDYDTEIDTKMPINGYITAPEIYSLASNEKIMINGIGSYPAVVPLELDILEAGNILLTITEMSEMQDYTVIQLEDRQTGDFYTINEEFQGISFDVQPGILSDRFFVHYISTVGLNENNEENTIIYSEKNIIYVDNINSEPYDIQVLNITGQLVYEGRLSGKGLQSITLNEPTAYYVVRLLMGDQIVSKKLFVAN